MQKCQARWFSFTSFCRKSESILQACFAKLNILVFQCKRIVCVGCMVRCWPTPRTVFMQWVGTKLCDHTLVENTCAWIMSCIGASKNAGVIPHNPTTHNHDQLRNESRYGRNGSGWINESTCRCITDDIRFSAQTYLFCAQMIRHTITRCVLAFGNRNLDDF